MNSRLIQGAGHYKPTPEGTKLLFGDLQLGYYGQIPQSKLITAAALITASGMTQGVSCNLDTTTWMKFAYKGKTLFASKQMIRVDMTMNHLIAKGLVTGNKTVVIAGKTYKLRLMRGAAGQNNPNNPLDDHEWNKLMYRVCPTGPGGLQKWDNIPHAELQLIPQYGTYLTGETWVTQEFPINGGYIISQTRGRASIDAVGYLDNGTNNTYPFSGWRPVLELVG
jgi:hypothetical protein